jgi:hypothetical protein
MPLRIRRQISEQDEWSRVRQGELAEAFVLREEETEGWEGRGLEGDRAVFIIFYA